MRPIEDIERYEHDEGHLDALVKRGRAGADVVAAIRAARAGCEEAGLDASFDSEGIPAFTAFQTSKAVRHTREDVSATLTLQLFVLERLDAIKKYLLVIVVLLVCILFRMSGI